MARPTKSSPDKKECAKCHGSYSMKNFYSADETLFPDGKLHICKKCTSLIMSDNHEGFLSVLRLINKPYLEDLFTGDTSSYIRQINSLPQYKTMTYSDSTSFTNNALVDVLDEMNVDTEVKMRWIGYEDVKDIIFLENFYNDLISTYESKTPIQRNIYKNMAETQLLANVARSQGKTKEFQDLLKTMSTLMTDAKIKPLQETGEQDGGLSTWGQWVRKIEETEPIPEAKEEFKDVDGIRKYISKWFTKHFLKVFGVSDPNAAEVESLISQKGEK